MRTAEEIAVDLVLMWDERVDSYDAGLARVAAIIRAARIEAVDEFRRRALSTVWDAIGSAAPAIIERRIAALPALPEGT